MESAARVGPATRHLLGVSCAAAGRGGANGIGSWRPLLEKPCIGIAFGTISRSSSGRSNCRRPVEPLAVSRQPVSGAGASVRHFASTSAGSKRLLFGRHVREAMANGQPIVALESTVITHGLPEPQNLELALSLERKIRAASATDGSSSAGCTPATLGIIRGQIVVGLSEDEIKFLANRKLSQPIKASRRDIPIALALGLSAGTTVAATMAIANAATASFQTISGSARGFARSTQSAIRVFATGGTGGVHRGGQSSLDISADLHEFARSPMGVVSSGFKSFLDTRRSLEVLETLGCTVLSLHEEAQEKRGEEKRNGNANLSGHGGSRGQVGRQQGDKCHSFFPAFYSRSSGIRSPFSVVGVEDAARILLHCLEGPLGEQRAMLLANPIPAEAELELENSLSNICGDHFGRHADSSATTTTETTETTEMRPINCLEDLLANVSAQIDKRTDLEGKDKTPLILEQINRLTGGKSLKANVALLENNARVGAQLAIEYARLCSSCSSAGEF